MMLARPSISMDTFFDELVVSKWKYSKDTITPELHHLTKEENIFRDKFFFGLSREYDWAKNLRWHLQKKIELSV